MSEYRTSLPESLERWLAPDELHFNVPVCRNAIQICNYFKPEEEQQIQVTLNYDLITLSRLDQEPVQLEFDRRSILTQPVGALVLRRSTENTEAWITEGAVVENDNTEGFSHFLAILGKHISKRKEHLAQADEMSVSVPV